MPGLPKPEDFARRAPRQHYSLGAMGWFTELVLSAPCSQRAAATIVGWLSQWTPDCHQAPCANTGRSWLFRLGLYELNRPKEEADDWLWMVDHTVQLGAHKGLVVVGLRQNLWQADPRPLKHEDVQLLHLEPMHRSTGQDVYLELEKIVARIGTPRAIISDGGADVKKGIELFRRAHPTTNPLYDITHKVALLLKKEFEADSHWQKFISASNLARRGLTLTNAGFLVPPGLKLKARYMNVDSMVRWGVQTLAFLDDPREVPGPPLNWKRVEARLGFLRSLRQPLTQWATFLNLTQTAEHYVRHQGWHAAAPEELRAQLEPLVTCDTSRRLRDRLLKFAAEQSAAARPDERLIGSTEVLESLIGKYKRLQSLHSGNGMTRTILAMGALVGRRSVDTLRAAFNEVTNRQVQNWCVKHLGLTLQARRHHAFPREQKQPPTQLASTLAF
jgi:hypothetical protein